MFTLNQALNSVAFWDKNDGWIDINLPQAIQITGQLSTQRLYDDVMLSMSKDTAHHTPAHTVTIGIDEVGRGPLYGSVVVAGAILPDAWSDEISQAPLTDTALSGLTDSKKISEKKREMLFPLIQQYSIGYVLVEIPASVIDTLNIFQATMTAMRLCAETLITALVTVSKQDGQGNIGAVNSNKIADKLPLKCQLLIDGNKLPEFDWLRLGRQVDLSEIQIMAEAWVKGDGRHSSMAAASVLAKVARDRQVVADAQMYPQYQLEKHKGYPTKAHLAAIAEHGVLPQHRRSFAPVKNALDMLGAVD
ncbi:ribonuclease HII [Psychrobacter sp. I-STPA6b]|uniref:ribonuclease HII n=1 Tax=Psychrobacter sp. I-STPA6b TaxID=2585718 RepID=UPI001D0C2DA3|nr:ribonuclease HII [Psychrobacter sp. I-STPA6b]